MFYKKYLLDYLEHPKYLKDIILYSETSRIIWICTIPDGINYYCEEFK